jgi:hypothetical protein
MNVSSMSMQDRLAVVIRRAGALLPGDAGRRLTALLSPTALAIMATVVGLWAASHFVGVGEIADVVLHPKAVHIMAGTNDIAGNPGAATMSTVQGNIASMAELAHAHGIKVILASTPPAAALPWSPSKRPAPQIAELTAWLRGYAKVNGYTYVDYHAALTTPEGGMKPGLSSDGVHPTPAGYAIVNP